MVLRGDTSAEIPRLVASARALLENLDAMTAPSASINSTLASLTAIRERIDGVAESIREIGGLSRDQERTGQEVAEMMGQTTGRLAQNASATHELASTVQEIAKTSDELARVAEGLRAVVGSFKL